MASKKRKATPSASNFTPYTIKELHKQVDEWANRELPALPENDAATKDFCNELRKHVETFQFLTVAILTTSYTWPSKRSGAAEQQLGHLQSEIGNIQDTFNSLISARISNILVPVSELVVDEIHKEGETKKYKYRSVVADPEYHLLSMDGVQRNAKWMLYTLQSQWNKLSTVLTDFQTAMLEDSSHQNQYSY